MISIITAVCNQLEMNKIFLDSLRKHTDGEWELIVVDNGSTDGSREFFESAGDPVTVIPNDGYYSYPYCQIIGGMMAGGDVLAYFHNDIILSPHWDTRILSLLGKDGREVLSLGGIERLPDPEESMNKIERWEKTRRMTAKVMGVKERGLNMMTKVFYGGWERAAEKEWKENGGFINSGFIKSAIVMTRRAQELVGDFDPTIQEGELDLYFRTIHRNRTVGDIAPMGVASGVFHHHYDLPPMTPPGQKFLDAEILQSMREKWGAPTIGRYMASMM
ncbi:MAG: glycosyltransferase [Muribaculaceae bacterium]|nr:glycosyltransferase [Muribaculaceae bacterium]